MTINSEISKILTKNRIPVKEGKAYLLSLYFDTVPNYIPPVLVQKMNLTKIYEMDEKTKTLQWNVILFEDQVNKFEWVKQYREAFRQRNKQRGGTLKACTKRMKDFFAENPDVRASDVQEAVNLYFDSVKDNDFLKSAHKFIYEGAGGNKVSMLEQWLEIAKEKADEQSTRTSARNTMR